MQNRNVNYSTSNSVLIKNPNNEHLNGYIDFVYKGLMNELNRCVIHFHMHAL